MKQCIKCFERKSPKVFYKDASRRDSLHPYCKACINKHQQANRNDRIRGRDKLRLARWAKDNTVKRRAIEKENRRRRKVRVINAYGGECTCCSEKEMKFLSIEHTKHDGKADRERYGLGDLFYRYLVRAGFPKDKGLAVLCMNCNHATRYGDLCPHAL